MNNSKKPLLGITFLLLVLLGCTNTWQFQGTDSYWPDALVTHTINNNSDRLKKMWDRSNVFIRDNNFGLRMSGVNGRVFILGSLNQAHYENVLALNGSSGELLWNGHPDLRSTLSGTESALYVGSTGGAQVIAHNPGTGEVVWSTKIPFSRYVRHIYAYEDTLYVNSSSKKFSVMQAENGQIVRSLDDDNGNEIFVSTDDVTFIQSPTTSSLQIRTYARVIGIEGFLSWAII